MSNSNLFVLGFDGAKGVTQPGTKADSTALVLLPVQAPAVPQVVGHWEDPGEPGWEPPRKEISAVVEYFLSKPNCAAMGADPSYWSDEVANWTAKHSKKLMLPRISLSSRERGDAWDRLYEAIGLQVVQFNMTAADWSLFEPAILGAQRDEKGRVTKQHKGPSAPRIDVAAALSYALVTRIGVLAKLPQKKQGWHSLVACELCGKMSGGKRFCSKDHEYKFKVEEAKQYGWPEPPPPPPKDRVIEMYGPQPTKKYTTKIERTDNGFQIVDEPPVAGRTPYDVDREVRRQLRDHERRNRFLK